MARRAHVDAGTISDMFHGRRRPVPSTVQALCMTLGLELRDALLFEDEAPVVKGSAAA